MNKINAIVLPLLLISCNGGPVTFAWMQEKEIYVHDARFPECMNEALKSQPGISINTANSYPEFFTISTGLPGDFGAYVKYSEGKVKVQFLGKGSVEPAELKSKITPLLESISVAIRKSCN
jgi:hypothetical protein